MEYIGKLEYQNICFTQHLVYNTYRLFIKQMNNINFKELHDKWINYVYYDKKSKLIEVCKIWENNKNLYDIIKDMTGIIKDVNFDKFAVIATKGIIFGAPLSFYFKKGMILINKKDSIKHNNKLFYSFTNWRNKADGLEIDLDNLCKNNKFIVIDDLIQTSASIKICKKLIEKSNNKVKCFLCFANLSNLDKIDNIPIYSLLNGKYL